MSTEIQSKRKIGIYTATAIVAANMIGTGVFTSLGFQVFDIQTGFSIVALWLIGGLAALSGALSYGELSAAMPRSGGEYHLLSKIYHPSVGFLSGWISVAVGFSCEIILCEISCSRRPSPRRRRLPQPWEPFANVAAAATRGRRPRCS